MTELTDIQRKITDFMPNTELRLWEPMSKHTSFRIGGPAEIMAFPKNTEDLAQLLKISQILDCNCAILGAGTNVLAPDAGVKGLVICLKDCLDGMERLEGDKIRVSAGVTMATANGTLRELITCPSPSFMDMLSSQSLMENTAAMTDASTTW